MQKKAKRKNKTGLPPGSLVYTGNTKGLKTRVEFISYNEDTFSKQDRLVEHIRENENNMVNWVRVTGIEDVSAIEKIGKQLDLSQLLLEDILNINQRPVFVEYSKALFVSLKALHQENGVFGFRQLSFVITKTLLISFSEEEHSVFRIIENHLSHNISRIRKLGADYLLHAFIDVVVDQYTEYLDSLSDTIELCDEKILQSPDEKQLAEIQQIRKKLIETNRQVSPLREVLNQLINLNDGIIINKSHPYFRDVLDHLTNLLETIKSNVEFTSNLKDFYMSRVSLDMNKIIQLLTIVSVIFIPLTFLAGVYGMNFENMPELHTHYGYFIVLGIMLLIFIAMLFFFRRKKWL